MKKYAYFVFAGVMTALYIWTVMFGNDLLQPSIASKILRFHVTS